MGLQYLPDFPVGLAGQTLQLVPVYRNKKMSPYNSILYSQRTDSFHGDSYRQTPVSGVTFLSSLTRRTLRKKWSWNRSHFQLEGWPPCTTYRGSWQAVLSSKTSSSTLTLQKRHLRHTHFLSLRFHTIDPLYGWFTVNHHKLDSGDRSLGTKLPSYLCAPVSLWPRCAWVTSWSLHIMRAACCLNQAVTIVTISYGDYYWVNVVDYILCTW